MGIKEMASLRHNESIASSDIAQMGGVDVLVVLGKNIGVGSTKAEIRHKNNTRRLSMETKMAVRAALRLVENGLVNRALFFSGGHTAGLDMPSEASAMFDYYYEHAPHFGPPVLLEEESKDTSTNAKHVRERLDSIISQGKLGVGSGSKIGLVTAGYHLERSTIYFENYGVPISWRGASEDLLAQEGERYRKLRQRFLSSDKVRTEELHEETRRMIQRLDPKGKIPQALTRMGWRS